MTLKVYHNLVIHSTSNTNYVLTMYLNAKKCLNALKVQKSFSTNRTVQLRSHSVDLKISNEFLEKNEMLTHCILQNVLRHS